MELKLIFHAGMRWTKVTFNRTFMELKHQYKQEHEQQEDDF